MTERRAFIAHPAPPGGKIGNRRLQGSSPRRIRGAPTLRSQAAHEPSAPSTKPSTQVSASGPVRYRRGTVAVPPTSPDTQFLPHRPPSSCSLWPESFCARLV
jgi:hypothetical protein